jgi:hypothetical protein
MKGNSALHGAPSSLARRTISGLVKAETKAERAERDAHERLEQADTNLFDRIIKELLKARLPLVLAKKIFQRVIKIRNSSANAKTARASQ